MRVSPVAENEVFQDTSPNTTVDEKHDTLKNDYNLDENNEYGSEDESESDETEYKSAEESPLDVIDHENEKDDSITDAKSSVQKVDPENLNDDNGSNETESNRLESTGSDHSVRDEVELSKEEQEAEPVKRGRGRPRKYPPKEPEEAGPVVKRKRGRPRKTQEDSATNEVSYKKRGRGRPPLKRATEYWTTVNEDNLEDKSINDEKVFSEAKDENDDILETDTDEDGSDSTIDLNVFSPKKKRGRPPLDKQEEEDPSLITGKRKRGRPSGKQPLVEIPTRPDVEQPKRGRGRPRKAPLKKPASDLNDSSEDDDNTEDDETEDDLTFGESSESAPVRKRGWSPKHPLQSNIDEINIIHSDFHHKQEVPPIYPPNFSNAQAAQPSTPSSPSSSSSTPSPPATPSNKTPNPPMNTLVSSMNQHLAPERSLVNNSLPKKASFQVTVVSPRKPEPALNHKEITGNLISELGFNEVSTELQKIKASVTRRLTGKEKIQLIGHEEEKSKLYQWAQQTVLLGEGNSVIVVGSRSSGKSLLVESVLQKAKVEISESFYTVRLNGAYLHDDKVALREISRQLSVELESLDSEDAIRSETSFADTLTRLLATLSHPSDLGITKDGFTTSASVIFILEEFDLFVQHPRQMLLYNLFDIAQSRKAPILVIGLTTRYDCFESLEKRVKSRFSHMVIHTPPPSSLLEFLDVYRNVLTITNKDSISKLALEWNSRVNNLLSDPSSNMHKLVQYHYYSSRNLRMLYVDSLIPITSRSASQPLLDDADFYRFNLRVSDHKVELVKNLSLLELALLICTIRFESRDIPACNFNSVYQEYRHLHQRTVLDAVASGALAHSFRLWGRDVALEAWEKLASVGLIVSLQPNSEISGALSRECQLWQPEVDLTVITAALREHKRLPSHYYRWLKDIA
ncbi:origin recognition complex subunit Orc4 [Schizosaccharomyces cryophilus OY26]|uniref:Origin recognition complex subunit Orc4 n=1 Tax=Schizosaccharomyces cryophilus (strain OY26 / ATCC MYA-4695 / CBS 11777 / NBRC 106824 / NRRL Y48691) TaxID=653667 RepID=S9XAF4_SCHCR|nr:origin recognition complex subunit Orc4 [Schizosaccharomyces cryophilus OY26]EPY54137.1 origin recognition complex subunit Orc4 [Schizosaccharomyces cryophilus OY26]